MELFVKIGADTSGLDSGMNQAESKAGSFAKKLGGGLKTAAKVGAAAVAAASAAVVSLTKDAVENYAEYEQLVGGVETLFKDSADTVMSYAENAYKTAGLSANQYMETVTSFSASLLQSLGGDTEKAANVADMAITDMADNANKMGTSMEAIQNAYQGFAKQNYTMLDNLKLGYGGTKSEMERLLADATALSGIEYNIDNLNDVYEAIHVVQTELGITGTTAKEASSTISGSLGMLESSWQNLVTGIADPNADLGKLIDNLVDSAGTAAENLIPVIEKALTGIVNLIDKLAPVIIEKLPALVGQLLPMLLNSAVKLVEAIVAALPELLQMLVDQLPMIMDMLVSTIVNLLPMLIDLALQLILTLADGIVQALPELIPALVDVILTIVEKLTDPDTLMKLVDAALQIIISLAVGLVKAIPQLLAKLPIIIINIVETLIQLAPKLLEAAFELIATLATGLIDSVPNAVSAVTEVFTKIKEIFLGKIGEAAQWGKDMIDNFIGGIKDKIGNVKDVISNVGQSIKDRLHFSEPDEGPLSDFHTYAPDMMDLFIKGIADNEDRLKNQIERTFDFGNVIDSVGASTVQVQPAMASGGTSMNQLERITLVFPIYLGGDKIDEKIINAIDAYNFKSGGRA